MTTIQARRLRDSQLFAAVKEARGYLANPHLDPTIAAEYRSGLDALESEIRRRDI